MANDFLQFATSGSANVQSQAAYAADSNRTDGNQPGVASSALNNKALRQANFVTSNLAQIMENFTGASVLDDGVTARFLQTLTATLQRLPPVITKYTSGSGNHNLSYYFFCASASATAGATYTNNGVTFTVSATIASGTLLRATGNGAPAVSGTLTKSGGTGDTTITFYAMRAPLAIHLLMSGGGGGGAGGGTTTPQGTDGNDSTFGTCTASKGLKGDFNQATVGGASTLGSGWVGRNATGGCSQGTCSTAANANTMSGGSGGTNIVGGAAGGGQCAGIQPGTGLNAPANSGGGGGGGAGGGVVNSTGGAGGSAAGAIDAVNTSPSGSYAYSVGAGGTGGIAGTSGAAGGNGGSGLIIVTELYQ